MKRLSSVAALSIAITACGGRVEGPDPTTSSLPSSAETEELPDPSGPEDGEWGTWQLLSLDGPDGQRLYDPPFVELDLHSSGEAYRWTCAAPVTGDGERCPAALRRGCLVGRVELSGLVWRVRFTNREGTRTEGQGDIVDEASGDIAVNGEGALHRGGHYRRVGAASHERCVPE